VAGVSIDQSAPRKSFTKTRQHAAKPIVTPKPSSSTAARPASPTPPVILSSEMKEAIRGSRLQYRLITQPDTPPLPLAHQTMKEKLLASVLNNKK